MAWIKTCDSSQAVLGGNKRVPSEPGANRQTRSGLPVILDKCAPVNPSEIELKATALDERVNIPNFEIRKAVARQIGERECAALLECICHGLRKAYRLAAELNRVLTSGQRGDFTKGLNSSIKSSINTASDTKLSGADIQRRYIPPSAARLNA